MVAKKYQSKTGGLNAAGRKYFNNKDGSNLKAPVTGKPKKGSKAAGRKAKILKVDRQGKHWHLGNGNVANHN
jgi:hypothetical protein